ncbi:MAG: hypothetical protein APF77_09310 [Clostridia bacterium BRH_c25]|nr:MAG: hypothetical protein APF77_09310 [Clostridia bacterium BRH_c25]
MNNNKKNFIYIEPTLCSGCTSCVSICGFNETKEFSNSTSNIILTFIEEAGFHEAIANCDGSPCSMKPKCINCCPTGALMWGTLQDIAAKKMILARERQKKFNSAKVRGPWTLDSGHEELE